MSYQRAYNNILYKKCITLLGIFVLVFIDYWSLLSHYGFSCFKKNSKKILPHNTLLPKLKSMFIHSGPSPFPSHTHTERSSRRKTDPQMNLGLSLTVCRFTAPLMWFIHRTHCTVCKPELILCAWNTVLYPTHHMILVWITHITAEENPPPFSASRMSFVFPS